MILGYRIRVEREGSSWGAWSPDLPGCVGLGRSREAALRSIRKSIQLTVDYLREVGDPVPPTWIEKRRTVARASASAPVPRSVRSRRAS